MSRTLANRLKRLEAKSRVRRAFRPIIFTLYDEDEADIVGLTDLQTCIVRRWQDSDLGVYARRASAALGNAGIMCARYAPERNIPDATA